MKINKNILYPLLVVAIYLICFCVLEKADYTYGFLIGINKVTISNIKIKFLDDFLGSLVVMIVIFLICLKREKTLANIGITKNSSKLVIILFLIYILMFFIKDNFTLQGMYEWFFYLIIVSASEEIVFRGYLFLELDREIPTFLAVVISGITWGGFHAILPIIINDPPTNEAIRLILIEMGNGIMPGALFILAYKKVIPYSFLF